MKLKTKYIVFIAAIHLLCLVMSYFIFRQHEIGFFMIAEIVIIISIVIAINLYRQLIRPLIYLKQGVNAIKDQDFNVKFLPTGKGEVDELVDVYNKMIDALRNERTTQQEQHFFLEKLIQTSPTGIIILDYDGALKQVNPKAQSILNAHPEVFEQLAAIQTGSSKMLKIDGLRTYKIQKSRFIDMGFERVFIMMEEVTAEIFAAEKQVYSKVIRMMAHEVNNTVGPVNSIINMALLQKNNWEQEQSQLLKTALQVAIDRNQNLNIFMRNFAELVKLPEANKKKVDLVLLIRSVAELMQFSTNDKAIRFEFQLPADPYLIFADVQQMEQALINIVKNAIDAIETTGTIQFTLDLASRKLIISNNGKGIAENDTEQLFSPFFSTKKDGQGIGLTLVREILLNHGYEFSLKTVAPQCTEFSIQLS
ncbi:PAS domain-containing sensor histidine kinase [Pedobacter sp. Hv1]|uniref:sensor histidine kinase n=1 Tax=Pedobacter sp. Hv1 TaxID=1740090 RepID=UPI0006D8A3AF|nr:ATP-binding protein [Pedobacter sp. Hv1]KQB98838.1 histidine kinase [Pedobacter sp. Hv1]